MRTQFSAWTLSSLKKRWQCRATLSIPQKRFDEATEMAQEIANLTGSQMGLQIIEQLKGQNWP